MPNDTPSDPYGDRKRLTFEQAEGLEPLPSQLQPKELTHQLRAGLWAAVYSRIARHISYGELDDDWYRLIRRKWMAYDSLPIDECTREARDHVLKMKDVVLNGSYGQVFGLLQWLIRQTEVKEEKLAEVIQIVLETRRAAYRVVDGTTIIPISSAADSDTLSKAFGDLDAKEFHGAKAHLRRAAEALTTGKPEDGVREAIQAVESVARALTEKGSFSEAMKEFEKRWPIHGALKAGFLNLYGYSSDQQGIRHPLIDAGHAAVDEADALFMLGACAACVSYLISKARGSGQPSARR